uniref:NADH-ubiquinone oxidoreductase chain 6 n=1 Tax=Peploptera acromialis TaxID=908257 RepID=E3VT41_9CUCU|nr:NADH dehydrogenase subunit 6 [Peploptera acromialis]
MKTLMMLIIMSSIMFCLMNHPLSLGVMLLIQTILIALISGLMNLNFWFSYIVFLIMIGGMLVLFIYMTSIASNEKFKFSPTLLMYLYIVMMVSLFTLMIDSMTPTLNIHMMESCLTSALKNPNFTLNKYMNYPHMVIYISMVIYLLMTLIAIVKITMKEKGALRQSF